MTKETVPYYWRPILSHELTLKVKAHRLNVISLKLHGYNASSFLHTSINIMILRDICVRFTRASYHASPLAPVSENNTSFELGVVDADL